MHIDQALLFDAARKSLDGIDLKLASEHGASLNAQRVMAFLPPTYQRGGPVHDRVSTFFWELLRMGLAMPNEGSYHAIDSRLRFSEIHLTPHGVDVLTGQVPNAHDRTGLLASFDEMVSPGLDPAIRGSFEGALLCFQDPLNMIGCAILLGVASEELVSELIRVSWPRIQDDERRGLQKRLGDPRAPAADRAEAIQAIWASANDLPDELKRVVQVQLPLVSALLRDLRNKGGHPLQLGAPSQPELFQGLNIFPVYCRDVKRLIDWASDPDHAL